MTIARRVVSLAGRPLRIEARGPGAAASVFPAISHLGDAFAGDAKTRWTIVEEDDAWQPPASTGAYRIGGGGFAIVNADPASLEIYRPQSGIELRGTPAAFAAGDLRAHPGCHALSAWLAPSGGQVMHAGAVAYDGAAALIVGVGGTGKSTTALACALDGAGYLGDDVVLVETNGSELLVHCLFATAKLSAESTSALGVADWAVLGSTPKNKTAVAVNDRLHVVRSAAIAALIVLDAPTKGRPCPTPMPRTEVLTALAPTALPLSWRTNTPGAWLAIAASLARNVPAYCLPVSWQLGALAAAVRGIVLDAAPPQDAARAAAS